MSDPWGSRPEGEQPAWGQPSQPEPPGQPEPAAGPPAGYGHPPQGHQSPYGQSPAGHPAFGQQPYGAPAQGYGAPYGYGPPPFTRQTSSKATTVMILGIVSLVLMITCGLGFIAAIIALVMAGGAEREIADSGGALDGQGQVKAGKVMSWITLGFTALGLVALVLFVVAVASAGAS